LPPVHASDALHEDAPLDDHDSVVDPPAATDVGSAANRTLGAAPGFGFGGGGGGAPPESFTPLPPPQAPRKSMPAPISVTTARRLAE
jgi:hypothetical protein